MLSTPAITIREASPQDVSLTLDFIRKKAAFDNVSHGVETSEAKLMSSLFGPQPVAFALFAEIDHQVVGYAIYFLNFSSYLARPGIWVEDLFIDEIARGRGAGRALLSYMAKIAADCDYGRIEWVAAKHNTKALEFYQRNGAHILETEKVLRLDRLAIERLANAQSSPDGVR
jgi:GNAT superfamily N-acetyltransferase